MALAAVMSARHLPQLRHDTARALGDRRVLEQHLRGKAGGQRIGVELRIALDVAGLLDFEQPRADVRFEHRAIEALRRRLGLGADRGEASRESAQIPALTLDLSPREIFEQVVVRMHAVECRGGRVSFIEEAQIVVNEVRERL